MPCSTPIAVSDHNVKPDEGRFLWSSLLEEVTHKAAVTLSSNKTLVVLGDDECGKTTLIARLQNNEDPKKGFGLEYNLLDVKDEERDDQTKLNVWVLDGNPVHSHLIKFAIKEEYFGDCMIMITVSMLEPWNIMDSLEKWTDILKKHIARLKLSPETLRRYKRNVLQQFCSYMEPDVIGSMVHHTTIPPSPPVPATENASRLTTTHPATAALLSSVSSVSQNTSSNISKASEDACDGPAPSTAEHSVDANVLTQNLGIPIIVVVTKTDAMNTLEKGECFGEEHFDFIQMHIRRFCLEYGAALFYVSVKEDKNCDLLNRYIQSRIYGFPFTQAAYVVERDCIFVPAGWDNEKKIGIQVENLTQVHPQSPYSEVIPRPPPRKVIVREPELHAQDEQAFLTKLLTQMSRDTGQSNVNGINGPASGTTDTGAEQLTSTGSLTTPSSMSGVGNRPGSGTNRAPVTSARAKGNLNLGEQVGAGNLGSGSSDSVLASFFNSLLSKRSSSSSASGPTASQPAVTNLSSDKAAMSQRDIQSELERLARCSRGPLDTSNESQGTSLQASPNKMIIQQSDDPSSMLHSITPTTETEKSESTD